MNFELGKSYIVDVTEKGIIPLSEFDNSKWYNKDYDDLDFLTDEEKIVVINKVLGEIRAEIEPIRKFYHEEYTDCVNGAKVQMLSWVLDLIDKYKTKIEE